MHAVLALWKRIIKEQCDFSVIPEDVNLVFSSPTTKGLTQLKRHVSRQMPYSFRTTDVLEAMSSSVSSYQKLDQLLQDATKCQTIRLIYPKKGTVTKKSGFMFSLCEASWKMVKPTHGQPSMLYDYRPSHLQKQAGREKVHHHSKIMLRENVHGRGWIYAGSANISEYAWCGHNFELGVLMTNVQMLNYNGVIPWERSYSVIRGMGADAMQGARYTVGDERFVQYPVNERPRF